MVIYEPEELRRKHQENKGSEPEAPQSHGDSGLVTDEDIAGLGI